MGWMQIKSQFQGVMNSDEPDMKFPWKGMITPIPAYGMFDESSNTYNGFVFYQSVADAEAATEKAGAAFKRMADVIDGKPKRTVMDCRLYQFSTFSLFEKRTLCPAAMSLSIVPLKENITKSQFFGAACSGKWQELQKEILFMAVVFGYFEEDGQKYGVLSAVYPTVELANLVVSRGFMKRLMNGEMSSGAASLADMAKAMPNRAVGEAIVVKV